MVREYALDPAREPRTFSVDYAAELNPQQHEVVMAGDGPLLVIAGAGSGKTRTITFRVSRLIESGVEPSRILLVTFTNKAAREMLERVERLIGDLARRVLGGTFHHVGHLILRRHADRLGFSPNFTIMDREDARGLISECVAQGNFDKGLGFPKSDVLGDWISFAENTGEALKDVVLARSPEHLLKIDHIEKVARRYAERKRAANLVDFDDLLALWRKLLQEHADVRAEYQERFEHILVDEYQDTNKLQGELIDLMAGGRRNITVVGDDAQSIYAWRGAHYANIMTFPDRYPGARVFKLEVNYRSTPEILALANDSIAHNRNQFKKTLTSARGEGEQPGVVPVTDEDEQARFVVHRIRALNDAGLRFEEMAVLYRAHHHSMKLDLQLTRMGIPFVMRSGVRFFEQAHVKDVVAFLRVVANPRDETAWKRAFLLIPGIGKTTAAKLWAGAEQSADPLAYVASDAAAAAVSKSKRDGWRGFVRTIADLRDPSLREDPSKMIELAYAGGYDRYLKDAYPDARERAEDLIELALFARRFDSLDTLLAQLSLQGNTGDLAAPNERDEGSVVLSTIHQAKGLEWNTVFVLWLAQGSFPTQRSLEAVDTLDEERRLFYVSVTRAKDRLYLCHPLMGRGGPWSGGMLQPSEFLEELDARRYELWKVRG